MGVDTHSSEKVWSACVRPVMTYAAEVWRGNKLEQKQIEREQNRAARYILGIARSSKMPTAVLHAKLG